MVMVIFGILTVGNVRKLNRLVAPASSTTGGSTALALTGSSKKNDRQLTKMLLVQVLILTILNVPYAIQLVYSTFSANIYKSPLQLAIENFCFALVLDFSWWAFGMSFYIYTLTGHVIRKELKRLMKTVYENVSRLTHRN
ncbi:unnamed protein product [Didymodactylos carnosus]|nr:unnamed protein product [Didymodactylos carnosus]CAF4076719.1 unnamed protein product [Didymodactylos carnosus]